MLHESLLDVYSIQSYLASQYTLGSYIKDQEVDVVSVILSKMSEFQRNTNTISCPSEIKV